jgi:AcrR family transcriptional regulator
MSTHNPPAPIWTQPAPGTRRPRFSREQIASAGLRIADREGFAALSMRRVADELGAGTMTLYHYVRTKDDLIALLNDAIMGELVIPEPNLATHWRAALAQIAHRSRAAFDRHPWALHALHGTRFGPNGMRHVEQSLAAVANTGMSPADQMALLHAVDNYVFGYALRATDERMRLRHSGRDLDAIVEFTTAQVATGHYPHITRLLGPGSPAAGWRRVMKTMADRDRFEDGLAIILDGAGHRFGLPDAPKTTRSRRSARRPA